MSAIENIIKVYDENVDDSEWVKDARAELAALRDSVEKLRAENAELRESLHGAECAADDLTAQNAEQARQIDEARKIIDLSEFFIMGKFSDDDFAHFFRVHDRRHQAQILRDECRAWLSATAPAPQDAQP